MSKIEQALTAPKALGIAGGSVAWPIFVPSPDTYATILNQVLIPTLGLLIALFTLLIKGREWWRGSRWSSYRKDESGGIGRRGAFGILSAAALAAAIPVVSQFEGRSLKAYRDIVGVATICDGVTLGVEMGDTATNEECDTLLARELLAHASGLSACISDDVEATIPRDMSVALISWTYNVGVGASCGSTLVRKLNAGDLVGACNELPRWNRAGERVVRGLTNRRAAERDLCLGAL
ncbi:lysozyme [Celeribacter sp.]|uniref:lysozyme n=1 Tax=Celeribacter sp. TaxID=1890673 RepID=UPI003A911AC1